MKNAGPHTRPIRVPLAEDNPGDVLLTQEVLQDAEALNELSVVEDGVKAMAYLRQHGEYAGAARPDLVLLDLNLPRKDGREVLAGIKTDEHLRRIPVVVMTTSAAERDILQSYDLHANCYLTKPLDLEQFSTWSGPSRDSGSLS